MKKCSRCKVVKPKSDFCKDSTRKGGLHPWCRICRTKSYHGRKDKVRNRQRILEFGVDNNWYNEKLIKQNGVCAICGQPESSSNQHGLKSLAIDHNHLTGQVRGLLCMSCNNGLGRFKENIQSLRNAIKYLEYFSKLTQKGA